MKTYPQYKQKMKLLGTNKIRTNNILETMNKQYKWRSDFDLGADKTAYDQKTASNSTLFWCLFHCCFYQRKMSILPKSRMFNTMELILISLVYFVEQVSMLHFRPSNIPIIKNNGNKSDKKNYCCIPVKLHILRDNRNKKVSEKGDYDRFSAISDCIGSSISQWMYSLEHME